MASCYILDHVIQECLHEKSKVLNTARGKSTEAKVDIYANAWVAVNAWIESRLCKQKGAGISGFATFGWEMLEKDGETHCRPIFLLSDDFVKTHRVRRQRIHHVPQLSPVEEINYSLLAIKFSKVLTKDMVFAGLRDIFRKIGEFIARGYELEIAFTFGVLRAKESRVKFAFSQSRLLQILPENLEPGVYAHSDQPMKYVVPNSERSEQEEGGGRQLHSSQSSTSQPTSRPHATVSLPSITKTQAGPASTETGSFPGRPPLIPPLSLGATRSPAVGEEDHDGDGVSFSEPVRASTPPSYPQYSRTNSEQQLIDERTAPREAPSSTFQFSSQDFSSSSSASHRPATSSSPSSSSAPPNLQEIMNMIEYHRSHKKKVKDQAKDRVMSQAFLRCLDDLHHEAVADDRRRFEAMRESENFRSTTQQDREKLRSSMASLKSALDEQMEMNRKRDHDALLEKKNTMMRFILPETAGMAPSPLGTIIDENGQVINGRQRIAKDLVQQIRKNEQDRQTLRLQTQEQERAQMDRLSLESELHSIVERSKYLEKQKALVEAWERDGHVRNLRKLQPLGSDLVQDYISKHLQDPALSLTALPRSLNQSLEKSIGYDPRKGKI